MLSIYFYTIVISFITAGVVFFIKNAAKMNGKYRLLTLTIGVISLGLFSVGFITPGLGFTGIFLAHMAIIFYAIFFLMSVLYQENKKDSD